MSEKLKKAFSILKTSCISTALASVRLEVNNNREAKIEGIKKILVYDDTIIKILVKNMNISFCGRNLLIRCLSGDSLIIIGFIKCIEFHT
ncbi:MAG: YabP/YqfC family sporulation protein [Candidatus Improbicoccus pseudotrichonymphae]|uniref:YabP/YqfC family sporulation protein n=1 Tax=Candidatus Improbicoccus pseudotrichonymphae TaxID=3033792 RepID=A0AA48IAC7_9FIRM|nr:MAG: YabP/YqfC family sporulation protein [Candidatus Improbicoccus pseudotrichonymphae]